MIKEVLKKFTKKLALALCVSAMYIGGAAVSAQAAESVEVQESDAGQAELSDMNADYLNFGQVINDTLYEGKEQIVYEFTLRKAGRIDIKFTSYQNPYRLTIYDSNGCELDYRDTDYNETLGFAKNTIDWDLQIGTYYLKVESAYSIYGEDSCNFTMKVNYSSAGANEKENNDSYATAMPITLSTLIKGQMALNDECDIYKIKLSKASKIVIKISSQDMQLVSFKIYDQNGQEEIGENVYGNDSGISAQYTYKLSAGVYYFSMEKWSYTGRYAFKITNQTTLGSKNVKLSKTKYEYDGKVKSPAVIVKDNSGRRLVKGRDYDVYAQSGRRNVGIYKVKVVFKGNYKGSAVKTLTIIPARTTITGIANKSNGIKIAWKQRKAANATGYIVYRSVNGGAYKAIKVIRSTRTTAFTDTGANSWWDTYSYKVVVYKNLGGKTYKSVGSNGKSIYRY